MQIEGEPLAGACRDDCRMFGCKQRTGNAPVHVPIHQGDGEPATCAVPCSAGRIQLSVASSPS
eukprot:6180475-Pleurochrysis_carterae.AAC.1